MVRLTSFLTLALGCALLTMVHQTEAACRQFGMECSDNPKDNAPCCTNFVCGSNKQCELASNLNAHDRDCIKRLEGKCKYPGSAPGFCDCCPTFNPPTGCYNILGKVDELIKANGVGFLKNVTNPFIELYTGFCKNEIERQEKNCDDCGENCIRTRDIGKLP
ncbi:hypothetical protein BY458DRAFT_528645 [Sporodiniella umbellata]|nr:hypothetical protein BY458DRAFT_528645 [Sporodiniella umbellata]